MIAYIRNNTRRKEAGTVSAAFAASGARVVKMKRLTSFILAFIMAFLCVSCAEPDEQATDIVEETESASAEETTYPRPDIPKTDFGGEKFVILYPGWGLYNDYFFAEEQTGEQMNDAIYKRTVNVEEYLSIDIDTFTPGYIEKIMPAVKASVLGGLDDYQLVLTHCIQDLSNMMISGYLLDWNKVPHINWDAMYWNQTIKDTLSIYGRLYYAASSYMIADPNGFLFNKQMVEEYNLGNPYALVKEGKWTLDRLNEMAQAVSGDLDGDGKYTVEDLYGLAAEADWMLISFMYGCDQLMVKRDETGEYVLDMYNDKMLSITEKLYNLFHNGNQTYLWSYGAPEDNILRINSGRVLFNIIPIHTCKIYRQSEVDFGILPFPKYDEAQEKYITLDWGGLMCIPTTAVNLDLIGMTNELLAYESLSTTIPAYYDVLLTGKFARDEESVDMLNIIYSSVVYDYGMNYCGFEGGFNPLFYMIPQLIAQGKSTDLSSLYSRNEKTAHKVLERISEKMKDVP